MKQKKDNKKTIDNYDSWKKIRNDWGAINPVTKVIPNKKKDFRANDIKSKNLEEDI